jgi:hypothetical protein
MLKVFLDLEGSPVFEALNPFKLVEISIVP